MDSRADVEFNVGVAANASDILLIKAVASTKLADTLAAEASDSFNSLVAKFNAAGGGARDWSKFDEKPDCPAAASLTADAASRIFAAATLMASFATATAADAWDILAAALAAAAVARKVEKAALLGAVAQETKAEFLETTAAGVIPENGAAAGGEPKALVWQPQDSNSSFATATLWRDVSIAMSTTSCKIPKIRSSKKSRSHTCLNQLTYRTCCWEH